MTALHRASATDSCLLGTGGGPQGLGLQTTVTAEPIIGARPGLLGSFGSETRQSRGGRRLAESQTEMVLGDGPLGSSGRRLGTTRDETGRGHRLPCLPLQHPRQAVSQTLGRERLAA